MLFCEPNGGIAPLTHDDLSSFTAPGAFGPYRVMHQIGVGVLGPVYRTHDPNSDRLVAIKAFHLDITPEQAGALAAELNRLAGTGLSHPSIVTPLGAGLSDGVAYLALEHVAAESLDVAIRHYAPATVTTALPCIVQLAEALDTAHALGLCHGALHLRDIFVTPELARVTGLGVVSGLERVGLRGPLRRPYTAPEQIAGADWGPAADRFALAAIAYELLTGKRAAAAGTGHQVTDRLTEVSGVRDLTGLTRLFAAALADTPESRPASARLFADGLADTMGWAGAAAIRQALVRMDGDAGDPVQRSGVEATGTEEAALAMAKTHRPDSTPEPELDWNERPLDRGEPDELRKSAAYQPRPPGGAADVAPPGRLEHDGVPDFESIDAALEENGLDVPLAVLHDAEAEDDPVADTPATGDAAPADPVEPRPHVEPRAPEPASEPAVPAATTAAETRDSGRAPVPADVSLFDQMEQDPDAPTDQSSFDAPGAVVPDDEDPADHAELDGSDPASDAPDSQAAGVYEAITLSELQDRLGETVNRPQDDPHDEAGWHAGSSSAVAPDHAASTDADDDDENAHDRSFAFEPASEDDYYHHGDDEDEARVGVLAGLTDRARGLPIVPLALITVVIVVAAFVAGFGWVAAGDDIATEGPVATGGVVAGGLADSALETEPTEPTAPSAQTQLTEPTDPTEPATPAPESGREFSEATVGRTAEPAPALVEPPPPPPIAEPAAEERDAPATVARAPVASEPAPAAVVGRLLVRSTPPGVRVAVNGEPRGTTPLALAGLPSGAYAVRLAGDGYESQEHQFVITADDPIVSISAELVPAGDTGTASLGVGSIFVDTRPRGVEVWLDQRLVGETPMRIPNVAAGAHDVEFRHDGYRDWATTVQVGRSAQARVTASLDPVPR